MPLSNDHPLRNCTLDQANYWLASGRATEAQAREYAAAWNEVPRFSGQAVVEVRNMWNSIARAQVATPQIEIAPYRD